MLDFNNHFVVESASFSEFSLEKKENKNAEQIFI